MAFSSKLAHAGSVGEHSQGDLSYEAEYFVTTDDAQAQSQSVLQWFRANVVELYTPYEYAGDTGGSLALAKRIRAEKQDRSNFLWRVTVTYQPASIQTQDPQHDRDESGNVTQNPLDWRFQINSGGSLQSEPAEDAVYVSGFGPRMTGFGVTAGKRLAVMGSNLIRVDPTPERDRNVPLLRIRKNVASWDEGATEPFITMTNSAALTINKYGYSNSWEANTLRLEGTSANLVRRLVGVTETEYWEVEWIFATRRATKEAAVTVGGTWDHWEIDRGRVAMATVGDPDGKGGTVAAEDLVEGVPETRRLVDGELYPYSDEHLLDGEGRVLPYSAGGTPAPVDPVKIRWRIHESTDFKSLPVVGAIFS